MASSHLLRRSRLPRLTALIIVALIVGAVAMASGRGGGSSPHRAGFRPLGLKGLELAAFTGKANLYLRMPPVTPATAKAKHASDVVLTGVSWNLTTPTDVATGLPSGRTQSAFGVKKQLDQFTPALAAAEVGDTVEKTATVYVTPTNTRDDELLIYTLTNVIITSDHQSATTAGSTEALTLSFQKLELSYLRAGKVVTSVSFEGAAPVN